MENSSLSILNIQKKRILPYYSKLAFITAVIFLSCLSAKLPVLHATANHEEKSVVASHTVVEEKEASPIASEAASALTYRVQLKEIVITASYVPTSTPTPAVLAATARQIGPSTWTVSVPSDPTLGTAQEIFQALNAYRQQKGKSVLQWDAKLASFAQSRTDLYVQNKNTDAHAGFMNFINNQDGFHKLGFYSLGENSSYGYHVDGTHLIESVYASDAPHDNNQLSGTWSHVGIGVNGVATDLVFGGKKM